MEIIFVMNDLDNSDFVLLVHSRLICFDSFDGQARSIRQVFKNDLEAEEIVNFCLPKLNLTLFFVRACGANEVLRLIELLDF